MVRRDRGRIWGSNRHLSKEEYSREAEVVGVGRAYKTNHGRSRKQNLRGYSGWQLHKGDIKRQRERNLKCGLSSVDLYGEEQASEAVRESLEADGVVFGMLLEDLDSHVVRLFE